MSGGDGSRRAALSVAVVGILLLFGAGLRLALTPGPARDDDTPAAPPAWTVVERADTAMGTVLHFKVACRDEPVLRERAVEAIAAARQAIERLEQIASTYREDSEISAVNRAAGAREAVPVSPELIGILTEARDVSDLSGGAFDITFASVGRLWRLDPRDPRIPDDSEIQAALALVDYRKVLLDESASTVALAEAGMAIDLGGIAKGTAIDWALDAIRAEGFPNALVEAGGDLAAIGERSPGVPWRIGIRHPRDRERLFGEIALRDQAVVTSGDYERFVEIDGVRYHHILDTKTGRPSTKSISVTVVADSCQRADALATAFFVLGPADAVALAERLPGVECFCLGADQQVAMTPGFPLALMR